MTSSGFFVAEVLVGLQAMWVLEQAPQGLGAPAQLVLFDNNRLLQLIWRLLGQSECCRCLEGYGRRTETHLSARSVLRMPFCDSGL